jgi:hypothetical protein
MPRNVRHKQEYSEYSPLDSLGTTSNIQSTTPSHVKGGKRSSSLNSQKKEGYSQSGRRAVSQPTNVLKPVKKPSKSPPALAQIPPLNAFTKDPVEDLTFNLGVAPKNSTPSPKPRLSHSQIEGTILLTRLKDHKIFRKVSLTNARTVDSLFKECAQRWPDKFGVGGISRLLYVDEESHLVEIVEGNSADYKELLSMIQRRWDNGGGEIVRVTVVLLADGEVEEM